MNKNKLFLFSSVLITVFIFATALICNFCGNPIEITVPQQETTEGKSEPASETTVNTQATSHITEAPVEGNNTPEIEEIELMGRDVESIEAEGGFDEIPVGATSGPVLTIKASDKDDDELAYQAYDSRGTNFEVTKIDNNKAEFLWELPSEAGPYTLTIEVSDKKGGVDLYSIDMNFVLPVFEFIEPENRSPEILGEIIIENLPGVDSPEGGPYIAGGIHYRVRIEATDPDGDLLNYGWNGGGEYGYTDPTANPTEWITPDVAATYYISVMVRDDKGGIDQAGRNIRVE